jgi:hypothetical protein
MIVAAVSRKMFAPGCDMVDPIIALSYFELYAASLGLGTLWDDFAVTVASAIPEVHKKLEIPDDYIFIAVLQVDVLGFITMNGDHPIPHQQLMIQPYIYRFCTHAKFTNRRFSAIIFVSYMITVLLAGWLEKTVIMAEMRRKRRK